MTSGNENMVQFHYINYLFSTDFCAFSQLNAVGDVKLFAYCESLWVIRNPMLVPGLKVSEFEKAKLNDKNIV